MWAPFFLKTNYWLWLETLRLLLHLKKGGLSKSGGILDLCGTPLATLKGGMEKKCSRPLEIDHKKKKKAWTFTTPNFTVAPQCKQKVVKVADTCLFHTIISKWDHFCHILTFFFIQVVGIPNSSRCGSRSSTISLNLRFAQIEGFKVKFKGLKISTRKSLSPFSGLLAKKRRKKKVRSAGVSL